LGGPFLFGSQQLQQLGDIDRDPPRLIVAQEVYDI
jgi:hypothetical protein